MSVCFLIWIVVRCWMRPDLAPQDEGGTGAHDLGRAVAAVLHSTWCRCR